MSAEPPLAFSGPEGRLTYWRRFFPWEDVWRLLAPDPVLVHHYGPENCVSRNNPGTDRPWVHHTAVDWRVARTKSDTWSLHAVPPADRYWVHDVDIRGCKTKPVCVTRGQHDAKGLCPACWASHIVPAVKIHRCMVTEAFRLPAPLYVFSGGNGLHIWDRLEGGRVKKRLTENSSARRFLTEAWLGGMQRLAAPATPIEFDIGPTDVHHRPPEHSGHPVKLPFSLHNRTALVATPLADPTRCPQGTLAEYEEGLRVMRAWMSQI